MPVTLQNANVVTCTGDPPLEDGSVVLEGDRIAWVGPAAEAPFNGGETVDCTGKTLLPGLVDAHAHLIYESLTSVLDIDLLKPIEQSAIDAVLNAGKLLQLGFTSIRDPGTRGNIAVLVRDAVEQGRVAGPRIKACKQIICVRGGLPDWFPSHVFGKEPLANAVAEIVSGPWQARDAVRGQVKDGVDWIKVEASGTGANPLSPAERDTMSFEELQAVCDEAAEKERPVICHAESRKSIVKAARAGVRTIEHAIYLDEEGLEAIFENDIAICPTLANYTAFAHRGLEFGIPEAVVANHRRTHEHHVASIRRAYEAGVTLIMGSDAGSVMYPQGGGFEEICLYVEKIGMTPQEALLSATRDAARVIGFEECGTLEAGKLADLLVLRESPLERIRALMEPETVEAVIKGGEVVAGALPAAVPTPA
jgi:imidazolonepropionase-like amidohydrolase